MEVHTLSQLLDANYQKLSALFSQIPDSGWAIPVQHDDAQWTVRQMLLHVVDSQRGITGQISRIRAGQETVPPDFDFNRWNKRAVEKGAEKTPAELLQSYATDRAALKALVDSLTEAELAKIGRHANLQLLTIEQFITTIANHEIDHGKQIAQALGIHF